MKKESVMALRLRPPAFGLPTGCPRCLPAYLYLRLVNATFLPVYAATMPDSDDLPIAEFGEMCGYSNEPGGVEEFLRKEKLCDLDSGLTNLEKSELIAFKSLVSHLDDALALELWSRDNEAIVNQIYLSQIPWPINRAIDWNMRRKVMNKLGINKDNAADREAEIYRRAFDAYEAFSVKKQTDTFFLRDKPTSLDAMLLGHLLFLLSVPLESSRLKEELYGKHPLLVQYGESIGGKLLKSDPNFPSTTPIEFPEPPRASTYASSSKSKAANAEAKRKQTPREKELKRKGKLFLLAQIAVVVGYVLFSGLTYEEDDEDGDDHDEE